MIYIQDILQAAVTRIVTGSTVANVTGTGPYTFTTAALKNMAVGQKIKIGIELYTVTNIAGLTITITGNVKPDPGTWVLPLNFRYGHRLEIDNILQNEAQNPANQGTQYPFLWLILNYPQRQIPELRDVVAYETDINLVLVTDTSKDYVATERLSNKFKTVFDYYFELLTTELNTSPILEYFQNDEILCTFTDRYFYGSFDKGQNVFNASYTDAREMEFAGLRVYKSICVPTPMLKNPATFTATLAGDPEAIVGTPYAFTLEVERTDTHPEANNVFSIVVAFGDGSTQTISSGLAIGQSVTYNLSHTYDIAGAITISVTGSASDTLSIAVGADIILSLDATENKTFSFLLGDSASVENCQISWGDGTITNGVFGTNTHVYNSFGTYLVSIFNADANVSEFITIVPENAKITNAIVKALNLTLLNLGTSSELQSVSLNQCTFTNLYLDTCPNLEPLNYTEITDFKLIDFQNCQYTSEQVDAILIDILAWYNLGGKTTTTINTQNNAAPTATGAAAKATLQGLGITVLTD